MSLSVELPICPASWSPLARSVRWVTSTRLGARSLAGILPHLDRWVLRLSGGRTTVSNALGGVPTLFLTTTGARSGQPRTAHLIAVPSGGDFAVIGSNFGRAAHPGWVANLTADPRATATSRGRSVPVIARELTGAEADQVWAAGRRLHRGFATYPAMATARTIRVFLLELASTSN
jgi:deazaflavin-dependent oxidoreductase (nitroreductase family)